MANEDLGAVARAGVASFRRNDLAAARRAFEDVTASGTATAQLWLYLALTCERMGDQGAMEVAAEGLLALEGRNLYGLTMKGAAMAKRGDDRAAVSYYQLALNNAGAGDSLPSDLVARLRVAETAVMQAAARFREHLQAHLASRSVDVTQQSARFRESLEILAGERQVFLQQPTSFFYSRLPHTPFFDRSDFGWVAGLEAAAPAILVELEVAIARDEGFAPYVQATEQRPNRGHSLLNDPRWSALHLFERGEPIADRVQRFPATMAALDSIPMPCIAGRSPSAFFSVLRPLTHIPPHNGMLNTRLICHLPLIVPSGCRLRVGNDTRAVDAGQTMIFDDSIEHEAWNDSDETRIVLIFEIWRPELNKAERTALTALFEAIGTYGTG